MNNKDKIAAQELIISTAQAEIKELKSQKGKRFRPKFGQEYWSVYGPDDGNCTTWTGDINDEWCYENFNCYETEALATKASPMMKRNNAIIMACVTVDPDFVPDYLSGDQEHYSFWYEGGWRLSRRLNAGPSVSTHGKWVEAAALLKKWGIE